MAAKAVEGEEENVWLTDEESCDVIVGLVRGTEENSAAESGSALKGRQRSEILVHTTCEVLVRNPFFATCLSEPWCKEREQDESPVRLTVETGMGTPGAYLRCIELLCSPKACSPYMFKCPMEALDIFLAADRLDFQECVRVCMEYLSAAPWSSEEEDAIRSVFRTTSLQPSSDVAGRLGDKKSAEAFKNGLDQLFNNCCAYDADEMVEYPAGEADGQKNQLRCLVRKLLSGGEAAATAEIVSELWARQLKEVKEKKPGAVLWIPTGRSRGRRWGDGISEWLEGSVSTWLRVTEVVLLETTDGKAAVEAFACDAELRQIFDGYEARSSRHVMAVALRSEFVRLAGAARFLAVLTVVFERVAEARVILPASARLSLLMTWLPWWRHTIAEIRPDEKRAERVMQAKRVQNQIIQTLPMDDHTVFLMDAISAHIGVLG